MSSLPATLKAARARQGLSLNEMAPKADCTAAQLSEYERGVRQPQARNLSKLATGYGVSIEDLLDSTPSNGEQTGGSGAAVDPGRTDDTPAHRPVSDIASDSAAAKQVPPAAA